MSKPAETPEPQAATPREVDLAAGRLLDAVDACCDPHAGFSQQIEAGLGAAFALFGAEPDIADKLVSRFAPESVRARQRRCASACADRLRAAAERANCRAGSPPFVETFLVASVQFELSRSLREDELSQLPHRVSDLRNFILTYYERSA